MRDELQPSGGWLDTNEPRLKPPPEDQRGWFFGLLSRTARHFGRRDMPDLFPVFHIHRGLFWTWLLFASRLMPNGRLPASDREKLILRTAWNCRSRYEWGQHIEIGLKVGLSDQDILTTAKGPQASTDPREQVLLQACDELCRGRIIQDDTWRALARCLDEKGLIEVSILVGHYQMLAGFLNSAGLRLEAPLEACLQAFNQRIDLRTSTA